MEIQNKYICSYEKRLIEENKKYWRNSTPKNLKSKCIYAFHTYSNEWELNILENLVAKGLQEKERRPVIAITYRNYRKAIDEMDRSFEIRPLDFGLEKKDNVIKRIYRFFVAKYFSFVTYGKKEKLFQVKYREIECGDVIHDEIIRWCKGAYFDCFDISRKQYFEYFEYALRVIDKAYAIFKKNKPEYFILNELCYIPGLVASVAGIFGAKVLRVEPLHGDMIGVCSPGKILYKEVKIADLIRGVIECQDSEKMQTEKIENRFVIETDKQDSSDLYKELGLDIKKKNIFIMAHALNDTPRCACIQTIYDNYNEWFLDTLQTIKNIDTVNWIIKDHPLSDFYVQGKYIRKVFEKNKTDNMYWCDKKVSGLEIKRYADCIITCVGDVGIEYWSYGIPTITTAKAYYCDWGISYNMKSREEYHDMLKHVIEINKPGIDSIERAEKLLTVYKNLTNNLDEFADLFVKTRKKEIKVFRKGDKESRRLHSRFSELYIKLLKEKNIKSSTFFLLENLFEV